MILRNISFTDIEGLRAGHAEDQEAGTGCTVFIMPDGAPCGIDVRGGGPASRETELLKPTAAAEKIHSVVLCGGSAFGLAAADGVMKYLAERYIGFATPYGTVPLVVASAVFDRPCGNHAAYPDAATGYAACLNSETNRLRDGNYGAGTGATVGKMRGPAYAMKSGQGSYAVSFGELQIGACIIVNALGDVYNAENRIIAGMLNQDKKGFADSSRVLMTERLSVWDKGAGAANTTIGIIATNGAFDKTDMNKIAAFASNGLARTIRPVNTTADGDSLYAVSTGRVDADINQVGELAAYTVERAIRRAVQAAVTAHGFKSLRDI